MRNSLLSGTSFEHCNKHFIKLKIPSQSCAIDETLYPYWGQIRLTQYNPSKPEKFGLLWCALCDTIVQCTNFSLAYAGKLHTTGTIRKHEILPMDYGLIGMTLLFLYEFIIISIHSLIYLFVHQSTHSFNHSFIQWTISMWIHHTLHPINLSIDPFFHMFLVYALIFHYLFRPIPIDWYFIYSFFFSPKFR